MSSYLSSDGVCVLSALVHRLADRVGNLDRSPSRATRHSRIHSVGAIVVRRRVFLGLELDDLAKDSDECDLRRSDLWTAARCRSLDGGTRSVG